MRLLLLAPALCVAAGCAAPPEERYGAHPGILWIRHAAEFDALALQVYRAAGDDLEAKIADPSWSALPGQRDAAHLPPAVILDVDETVVSNVEFQLTLEPPFRDAKLNAWNEANVATPVPGVVEFAKKARALGVELFFVTNRPCEPAGGDPCPQQAVTVEDINEAGIPTPPERVMLAYEQPDWGKEKQSRRDAVARHHRVIMLFGDDLGDFLPCSRRRPAAPCTRAATAASRERAAYEHRDYWGNGWYVLPNPMHGSWTSFR